MDRLLAATDSTRASGLEEESAEATLTNVEEMLDGYEWAGDATIHAGSKRKRGAADQIEARLHDELMALEKVGDIHHAKPTAMNDCKTSGQHLCVS